MDCRCDKKCELVLFKARMKPYWIDAEQFTHSMRYGYLRDVGADQIAYATQASEAAYIVSGGESMGCEVKLEILKENFQHSDENMYIAFNESDSHNLSSIVRVQHLTNQQVTLYGLYIQFEVKHSYFNSLVKAVNRISPLIIARILPTAESFLPLGEYDDEVFRSLLAGIKFEIDQDQFKALRVILSCERQSPPILLNGSFGTGKTRLLAATTYCLIHNGIRIGEGIRILICAHHQGSPDHFMKDYFNEMFRNTGIELVRLSSNRHGKMKWSTVVDDYIRCHRRHSEYLVIVTTFNTASHLSKIFEPGHFTHILLDEGSQAREPDSIAPLCLAGPDTKIVIAGDSCQVKIIIYRYPIMIMILVL